MISHTNLFILPCCCLTRTTAQQEAEKAKYIVLGAQQEKKTIITKAKGEAESAELIGFLFLLSSQDNVFGLFRLLLSCNERKTTRR